MARLNDAGIAAGPVNDLAAAIAFADSLGLDPTMPVGEGHPDQIRHSITWGRSRLPDPTPPPDLGEHTDQIRAQLGHQPKETR